MSFDFRRAAVLAAAAASLFVLFAGVAQSADAAIRSW
jgi:hypothetical protein